MGEGEGREARSRERSWVQRLLYNRRSTYPSFLGQGGWQCAVHVQQKRG